MFWLTICGLTTLMVYIVSVAIHHGIQDFVSDGYYVGCKGWLFSFCIVFAACSLLPYMIEVAEPFGIFALLTTFCLSLVGLEPHYKSIHGKTTHAIGAYGALISGSIWSLIVNPYPLISALLLYGILMCFKECRKHPYFFGEVLGMLGIGLSVILT